MLQRDTVESGLLRRVLTDPATGLPNTLYLDLVREWEQRRAEREGERVLLLALEIRGGDESLRRRLLLALTAAVRRSDFIASEGEDLVYLLLTVPGEEGVDVVRDRVAHEVDELNDRTAPDRPLTVTLDTAEL